MSTRTIATYCLHKWQCSDIPGVYNCDKCEAEAYYERDTKVYWIED